MNATDEELVVQVLAGERDLFEEIIKRYRRAMFRLALSRLHHTDRADDAVQESFFNAFRSLHTFNPRYSFRTWLWTIMINQCRAQLKRQARDAARNQIPALGGAAMNNPGNPLAEIVGRVPEPSEVFLARERSEQLDSLLNRLPDVEADSLRLRFFGDLKFAEIADVMQCSLSAAKIRVRRGLTRMGQLIVESDYGFTQQWESV